VVNLNFLDYAAKLRFADAAQKLRPRAVTLVPLIPKFFGRTFDC